MQLATGVYKSVDAFYSIEASWMRAMEAVPAPRLARPVALFLPETRTVSQLRVHAGSYKGVLELCFANCVVSLSMVSIGLV